MDRQIGSLTSLRGIAAVIIVIHHFAYYTLPQLGEVLAAHSSFFRNGYLCVDLFFILSGFIMTHVYLDRFKLGVTSSDYCVYLRARFARIYPLHLFTLLFLVGLELFKLFNENHTAFTGKFNLTALFTNLFLLQAFDLHCPPLFWCGTYWNEPAWSISVEFMIYSIFPWLLFSLSKTNFKTDLIAYITTLVALLLLIKLTRGNLDSIIGIPAIARCGLECTIGIITYKIYQSRLLLELKYLPLGAITILAVTWVTLVMHNWVDNLRGVHDWSILPAFSLLILGVANQNNGFISKLMNSPPFLYLGARSYSIYLVHWCLAELLKTFWLSKFQLIFGNNMSTSQSLIALGLFIPIVLITAAFTYRSIEVPLRNLIRQQEKFLT